MQLDTACFPLVSGLCCHTQTQTQTHTYVKTRVCLCVHTQILPSRQTLINIYTYKHSQTHTRTNTHTNPHTYTHTHTHLPVSQLCFHQSVSFGTTERWRYGGMVMCCAQPRKAVKTLAPWMRERGNSSELLSSARSGPLIMPLCRVMASCTVLSVSAQLTLFL